MLFSSLPKAICLFICCCPPCWELVQVSFPPCYVSTELGALPSPSTACGMDRTRWLQWCELAPLQVLGKAIWVMSLLPWLIQADLGSACQEMLILQQFLFSLVPTGGCQEKQSGPTPEGAALAALKYPCFQSMARALMLPWALQTRVLSFPSTLLLLLVCVGEQAKSCQQAALAGRAEPVPAHAVSGLFGLGQAGVPRGARGCTRVADCRGKVLHCSLPAVTLPEPGSEAHCHRGTWRAMVNVKE